MPAVNVAYRRTADGEGFALVSFISELGIRRLRHLATILSGHRSLIRRVVISEGQLVLHLPSNSALSDEQKRELELVVNTAYAATY